MAKSKTVYVCSECGYETGRWLGRCPECGSWNTLQDRRCASRRQRGLEKKLKRAPGDGRGGAAHRRDPRRRRAAPPLRHRRTGSRARRRRGGRLAWCSSAATRASASPRCSRRCAPTWRARARRCSTSPARNRRGRSRCAPTAWALAGTGMYVLSENDMTTVERRMEEVAPRRDGGGLHPDHVSAGDRLRARQRLAGARDAPRRSSAWPRPAGCSVFLVGHVTKEGSLAGPRVLEHMVDAVLYFRGRPPAPLPAAARGEEPLRLRQRTGHVRNDRRGHASR